MSNLSLIMPILNQKLKAKEELLRKTEYPRYLCAELRGYIKAMREFRKLLLDIDVVEEG